MTNQKLERNFKSKSYLETSLIIEEIVVAYPDNPLKNPGKIFIARVNSIIPNLESFVDIKLTGNSYEILKYDEIGSELKDFVNWRIAGKPKNEGGIGSGCVLARYSKRSPKRSIIVSYKDNDDPILELKLLPTRRVKEARFSLWGDDLKFLREELFSVYDSKYKSEMNEEK